MRALLVAPDHCVRVPARWRPIRPVPTAGRVRTLSTVVESSGRRARLRAVAALTSGPLVQRFLRRTQQSLDEGVFRLSGGRTTFAALTTGLEIIVMDTVGARSGQLRRVVLLAVPTDGGYLVAGSNYARERNPAWVHNVRANPEFVATLRGRPALVRADELRGPERDRGWRVIVDGYPGMAPYERRAAPRVIPVFRIVPVRTEVTGP